MTALEKAKRGIYPKCSTCGKTNYYIAKGKTLCDKCSGRVKNMSDLSHGAEQICSKDTHTQEEMRELLGYPPIKK